MFYFVQLYRPTGLCSCAIVFMVCTLDSYQQKWVKDPLTHHTSTQQAGVEWNHSNKEGASLKFQQWCVCIFSSLGVEVS